MKFNAILQPYTEVDGYVTFQFPCAGILKNISIILDGTATEIAGQDNFDVILGEFSLQNVKNKTPWVDDELNEFADNNKSIRFRTDNFEAEGAAAVGYQFFHSKHSLRVRADRVYKFGAFGKVAGARIILIAQGDFEPYDNAYFKQTIFLDNQNDDTDFDGDANDKPVVIPANLKNCVLEYDIQVDNASEVSALVQPLIINRKTDLGIGSTGHITGPGTLDGSVNAGSDVRYGNSIDSFLIGSAGTGFSQSSGKVAIRDKILSGDRISFDMTNLKGDISTVTSLKMAITIHGRIDKKKYGNKIKSHFCESNYFQTEINEGIL